MMANSFNSRRAWYEQTFALPYTVRATALENLPLKGRSCRTASFDRVPFGNGQRAQNDAVLYGRRALGRPCSNPPALSEVKKPARSGLPVKTTSER